jgi:hypothetical protein
MGDERSVMIARRTWHRIAFAAAGFYNIGWGLYAAIDPQWFFRFTGLPPINHPEIYACLGMVIGLYGLLYLEVARVPETGFRLAAVGLIGKVLGPIGMAHLIWTGHWPLSAAILCATNDVIWWLPFGLYLYDARHSIAMPTSNTNRR